jgi:predicted RNase H-like HicB family nuclease
MKHYVAIFVQNDMGEWRVVFPDIPGCEAKGFSLDDAKFAATTALAQYIDGQESLPEPMDLAAIDRKADWLAQNHIDLSKAVISIVPLAV